MGNTVIAIADDVDGCRVVEQVGRTSSDRSGGRLLEDEDRTREVCPQAFKLVGTNVQLVETVDHDQVVLAGMTTHIGEGGLSSELDVRGYVVVVDFLLRKSAEPFFKAIIPRPVPLIQEQSGQF